MNQDTGLEVGSCSGERVLLVDDEPLVLEGLRRSIYTEFVADLAEGPEAGLAKLRKDGPYPVVVSDMRMPSMDGAEFLATVRALSPDSIRVMLTGHSDMEAAARAVNEGMIFRFLTKPVTTRKLLVTLRECVVQYHAARIEKEQLKITVTALEQLDLGTLTALARAIDAKSKWTAGHSERVTDLALKMGHAMGLLCKEFGDHASWRVVARHREDWNASDHSGQARQTRTWGNADYAGPREHRSSYPRTHSLFPRSFAYRCPTSRMVRWLRLSCRSGWGEYQFECTHSCSCRLL